MGLAGFGGGGYESASACIVAGGDVPTNVVNVRYTLMGHGLENIAHGNITGGREGPHYVPLPTIVKG